jgi:hypothetical protein
MVPVDIGGSGQRKPIELIVTHGAAKAFQVVLLSDENSIKEASGLVAPGA